MKVRSGGRIKVRAKKIAIALVSVLAVMGITIGASNAFDAKAKTTYADIEKFPDSYKSALYALKEKHPNWTFEVMETGLDWNTVVSNEMNPDYRSLVPTYFDSKFVGRNYGDGWACATQEAVEYYLDPRNWFTEDYIFQFEKLTYNDGTQGIATVQKVLQNTFMSGYIQDDPTHDYASQGLTYAKAFFDIGKHIKVSPVHLATRVKQEQGTQGTSDLISGVYPGYEGYYNYYNIQASGKTHEEIVRNGLNEAKSEGWNNRYAALLGGSQKVADRYILRGQDTLYLQKFDVDGQYDERYWHQYMQNLAAPSNEGRNTKRAYESAGMLDEAFVFKIPVYKNMPGGKEEKVRNYVKNLYKVILGRDCSYDESSMWTDALCNDTLTAADAIWSFISSEEYTAKNTSNEAYIKMLYSALFERTPSKDEVNIWTQVFDGYHSRKYVYQQFVSSKEFETKCNNYGITAGSITLTENEEYENNTVWFIVRAYRDILGRECSNDEIANNYNAITAQNIGCAEIAMTFTFSDEYTNKNTDNSEYVRMLYKALLNREASADEINMWVSGLNDGYSRRYIFWQFASSQEYIQRCEQYGLNAGNVSIDDNDKYADSRNLYIVQLYNDVLGRECSDSERKYYYAKLNNGTGWSEILYELIFGTEYSNKNAGNTEYVSMLYKTVLNREASESEIELWVDGLDGYYSRKYIFSQFVSSEEFSVKCSQRQLVAGTVSVSYDEKYSDSIAKFISELYIKVLRRECSNVERRNWHDGMNNSGEGCAEIAYYFVFSDEYINRNVDNAGYIKMLYRALLDREPTDDEVAGWNSALEAGYSRENIYQQFTLSDEFKALCGRYGLPVGSVMVSAQVNVSEKSVEKVTDVIEEETTEESTLEEETTQESTLEEETTESTTEETTVSEIESEEITDGQVETEEESSQEAETNDLI